MNNTILAPTIKAPDEVHILIDKFLAMKGLDSITAGQFKAERLGLMEQEDPACVKCGHPLWPDVMICGTVAHYCPVDGYRVVPKMFPLPKGKMGANRRHRGRQVKGRKDPIMVKKIMNLDDKGLSRHQIAENIDEAISYIDECLKEGRQDAWKTLRDKQTIGRQVTAWKAQGFQAVEIAEIMDIRLSNVNRLLR